MNGKVYVVIYTTADRQSGRSIIMENRGLAELVANGFQFRGCSTYICEQDYEEDV